MGGYGRIVGAWVDLWAVTVELLMRESNYGRVWSILLMRGSIYECLQLILLMRESIYGRVWLNC
ncbi:hypothetical protein [Peribacillus sp. Bi134]|uniref:hypothetical protein n=1 Tax=Peribacillus sp. Bi134 TaxID=2884272 RepID=UPI001E343FA8|nr:hypothetical protein [Peribacillus sp. Bi134]